MKGLPSTKNKKRLYPPWIQSFLLSKSSIENKIKISYLCPFA